MRRAAEAGQCFAIPSITRPVLAAVVHGSIGFATSPVDDNSLCPSDRNGV